MPAGTVRFGILSCAVVLSVLWLLAGPLAFGQNPTLTDARPSDVGGDPGEKDKEGKLPPGLIQARQVLPEMEIDNELYTDGDEKDWLRNHRTKFESALKSSNLTDDEKKELDLGAKYYIYRFTMKKYREEEAPKKTAPGTQPAKSTTPGERLPDLRKKLLNDIKLFAKTQATREYFLKQITERCAELLDNHFVVRQNIILLLGQLPVKDGNPLRNVEPTPYDPAYSVLVKVLKDDKQHQALKISAVIGLIRICRFGMPESNDKRRPEIAMALVSELVKTNTHYWYQFRLAECLGAAGVTYDPANKTNPVVLQTLAEVVVDQHKKRHFQARVEAAKAIGRLPLDGTLNMTPVIYSIVSLGHEIVLAYNANPKQDVWGSYFYSKQPGYGLYFAFKAERPDERIAGGKRKAGLLDGLNHSKEAKDAYEQILQMTLHFIDNLNNPGKPFEPQQLKSFQDWLTKNSPQNSRITATTAPLWAKPSPNEAKPAPANGSSKGPSQPAAGP